jgi:hypothetical protein
MKKTIKGILTMKEWGDMDLCVEYIDPEYEVYSYSIGDGIWGFFIRSEEEFEEAIELWGEKNVYKALDEMEDIEVEIPIQKILDEGYSIRNIKTGKIIHFGAKDIEEMSSQACWYDSDGNAKELDSEDSPLTQQGLI